MNKLMQEYTLPMSEENRLHTKPGQFVCNEESNTVTGFISEVNIEYNYMRYTLFEPIEFNPSWDIIWYSEEISVEYIKKELKNALEQNPEMRNEWIELINQ